MDPSEFDRIVGVNLRGVFLSMKFEIPAMLRVGGGAIVNMSSTVGLRGWQGIGAYVAAKHGVIGLTESTALEYADRGIRINAIAPVSIMTDRIGALPEEQRAPIAQAIPMHRIGLPEEVAATAAWLCSDEAAFVTGSVVSFDGCSSWAASITAPRPTAAPSCRRRRPAQSACAVGCPASRRVG
jgi:NAD(P)-dependent dehydrogenase (short-subunit alcohol dehydrogenase family)